MAVGGIAIPTMEVEMGIEMDLLQKREDHHPVRHRMSTTLRYTSLDNLAP
jgi:hypothetical protein